MPTFHARSELVQLNVVVRDKAGAPITGLKQSDFKVFEAGRPRDVAFFEEVHPKPLPPAEPGVFSNLSASKERLNVTMILLDLLDTPWADQIKAREELVKQLTSIEVTPNPTALYILNHRGLEVVHEFTSDSASLAAALKRVGLELQGLTTESPAPGTTPQQGSLTSFDLVDVFNATRTMLAAINEEFQPLEKTRRTGVRLQAINQLIASVEGIVGRKSLVWIAGEFNPGDDFPFATPFGSRSQFGVGGDVQVSDTIAVYPVDARGLVAFAMIGGLPPATGTTARRGPGIVRMNTPEYEALRASQDIMKQIAEASGGRAFANRNDLGACVREAMADSGFFYTLAFYAQPGKTSGWERRKLAVILNVPNAEARTRNSYMYHGNGAPSTQRLSEADQARLPEFEQRRMNGFITSPVDSAQVALSLKWGGIEPGPADPDANTRKVNFQLKLPLSLDLTGQINLELRMFVQQADGSWLGLLKQSIAGKPQPEQIAQLAAQGGFVVSSAVFLKPGEHRVRAVVRERSTDRFGTVTAPITVP